MLQYYYTGGELVLHAKQDVFRRKKRILEDPRMERTQTKGNEKIALLFDTGTFVQTGAYIKRAGSAKEYEGVICGYGSIGGKLAFAFVQDGDRLKGAFDATGAKKISALYQMAISAGAPIIGVFDSAGALVPDGSAVLSAYSTLLADISAASGVIPQIAIVCGTCSGLGAVAASMLDVRVVAQNANIYLAAGEMPIGADAFADILCKTEQQAFDKARALVALLPQNNKDYATTASSDDPARPVVASVTDTKALICDLCDADTLIALGEQKKDGMMTYLASIGGVVCGIVATDRAQNGGKITKSGARRAAQAVSLCDSLGLPVLTLVDSEGIAPTCSPCSAKAYGALAGAYANAKCPKVTVVTGNAYGAAFSLLCSRAGGADLALALPEAIISVMSPQSAVAFLYNDQITQEKSRAELEAEWKRTQASAVAAAEKGDIDDIIPAEELRARICAALYMLGSKAEGTPVRRHANLPL